MSWFGWGDEDEDIQQGDQYRAEMGRTQEFIRQSGVDAETVLANYRQQPNSSPGLVTNYTMSGAPPEEYGLVAENDTGQDDFNWWDPSDWVTEGIELFGIVAQGAGTQVYEQLLKPLVRGAFAISEGLSQELVQRPLSALMAGMQDGDTSIRQAYNEYGTSALFQGLGNVIGEDIGDEVDAQGTGLLGSGFDLGTGFFTGGAAMEQQDAARTLEVAGQQANVGRLFLDPALSAIGQQPGDRIYDITTGVAQFAAEVLLDPLVLVTGGTAGVAKVVGRGAAGGARLGRAAGFLDDTADIAAIRKGVADALTVDGTSARFRAAGSFTEVVDGQQVRQSLSNPRNRLLDALGMDTSVEHGIDDIAEAIRTSGDSEAVADALREAAGVIDGPNGRSVMYDKLQSFFRNDGIVDALVAADADTIANGMRAGRDTSLPIEFIAELGAASTRDEVYGILQEAITHGHIETRNFYGGFANRAGGVLRHTPVLGQKIEKFSGIAARGFLDSSDKGTAAGKLLTMARQAGLDRETRNEILTRVGRMQEGDQAEMFAIAGDVYQKVSSQLRGVDPAKSERVVKDLTDAYNSELEGLRQYFTNEFGEAGASALPQRTVKKFNPDGSTVDVLVPQPHLLSEFNKYSVPIPEIDDIRRAATQSDTMRAVYESAGWKFTNRSLRFVTRQLFKPLVLLRPAYIARTQLDDQMRMWAAGVDGIFQNPRHLIQMAGKAPGDLADLAQDPNVALYARKVLNNSILDVDGTSIAKPLRQRVWTAIQKPVPSGPDADIADEFKDYITAWRHELGQLSDDQIASYLIRNGLDVEDAVRAIMGSKSKTPAIREAVERRTKMLRALDDTFGTFGADDLSTNAYTPAYDPAIDPPSAAPTPSRLRELDDRALAKHMDEQWDLVSKNHDVRRNAMIDNRPMDTLVNPINGKTIKPDLPDPDAPPAPVDGKRQRQDTEHPDDPWADYEDWDQQEDAILGHLGVGKEEVDELDELLGFGEDIASEPITLEEFMEKWENSNPMEVRNSWFESKIKGEWYRVNGFMRPLQFRGMVKMALEDAGFVGDDVAEFTEQLTKEWQHWAHSATSDTMHQNTLRESGVLNELVRQSGPAGMPLYRGQTMPQGLFNKMMAEGVFAEGQIYRIPRLSSTSTDPEIASKFARMNVTSWNGTDQPVQVFIEMNGEVRAANLSWSNSTEAEMIVADQPTVIREIREIDHYDAASSPVDADGNQIFFDRSAPAYIMKVEAVPDGSIVNKVMEEGTQPFMIDMNRGTYDGTAESLAGKNWDRLSPAEQDEYVTINSQIEKWKNAVRDSKDRAFLQYHSELRHLVDNAPSIPDEVYLPGSAVSMMRYEDRPRDLTSLANAASGLDGALAIQYNLPSANGVPIRTDVNKAYRQSADLSPRDRRIPERITEGFIDPSMIDEDVMVRLPRGSQALRIDAEGRYLIPPSNLTVTKIETRHGKTIVDVEIDTQPNRNKVIPGDPARDAPLQEAVTRAANSSNKDLRRLMTDEDTLREYLNSVVDRIRTKTGDNPEILRVMGRDTIDVEDGDTLLDMSDDAAFEKMLAGYVVDDSPAFLKAQRFPGEDAGEQRRMMETITAYAYENIVSKPAGYLSRYPAWMEMMARDGADMMPMMRNDEVREEFIDLMESQMKATPTQVARLREAAAKAKGVEGVVANADQARRLALMHATESVENLLFDVTNKSAFQDAFDVIFPFVDAWREGLEVWSRLVKNDPSILLKGLAGARGAEESGAIYTNDRGERMFAMPFSGAIGNMIERKNEGQTLQQSVMGGIGDTIRGEVDEDSIDNLQTKFGFRVSGVNMMMNSVGPGFGPIVQWPAGAFLPDTPQFSGLQELINPYGTSFDEAGDFANPKAYIDSLTPAWFRKVANGWTGGDIDPLQWNGALHDSLTALETSGRYDVADPNEMERLTEDAERAARWMLVIRGLVHGVAPTGPTGEWAIKTDGVDEDFAPYRDWDLEADPDGVWHEIGTLSTAYYEIYDQVGDSHLATQKFMDAYGVTPAYLRTGKSKNLSGVAATKEGFYWTQENKGALLKYPLVAGLFSPPMEDPEDFDYSVWIQQHETGQRESLTAGQQIALSNRSMAQQIYYNAKDRVTAMDLGKGQTDMIMSAVKGNLNDRFPGWEIGVSGVTSIPTDQKIEQLKMAAEDPALNGSPATQSIRSYFAIREQMLSSLRSESGSDTASFGRQDAEKYREILLQVGATLTTRDPAFRGAWDLLRREID